MEVLDKGLQDQTYAKTIDKLFESGMLAEKPLYLFRACQLFSRSLAPFVEQKKFHFYPNFLLSVCMYSSSDPLDTDD